MQTVSFCETRVDDKGEILDLGLSGVVRSRADWNVEDNNLVKYIF